MKFSLGASLCAVGLLSLLGTAPSSQADPKPYCIAYARDLANRKVIPLSSLDQPVAEPAEDLITATASVSQPSEDKAKLELYWRKAFGSAIQSCLEQYSEEQPKRAVASPKPIAPAKPVTKKAEKQANATAEAGAKRGSEEWKKKCLAQHPSFNADTGTYRTWSGAQRDCRL